MDPIICTQCGEPKTINEMQAPDVTSKRGYRNPCRQCKNAEVKRRADAKRAQRAEAQR